MIKPLDTIFAIEDFTKHEVKVYNNIIVRLGHDSLITDLTKIKGNTNRLLLSHNNLCNWIEGYNTYQYNTDGFTLYKKLKNALDTLKYIVHPSNVISLT